MNDTSTQGRDHDVAEPARPLGLAARGQTTGQYLARRVMPDAVPDDGMAPLDVAAFTSSI